MKRILLIVVALVVIVGIFAALSGGGNKAQVTSGATPVPTQPPKVGDTIKAGNWQYQVTKTEQTKTVKWSEFGNTTDAKGVWQVVQVKVQNIGKESLPINAWDFEVRDSDGITYKADSLTSAMYSKFLKLSATGDTYPPNVPAEIALLFDVNPSAKGLRLNLVQAQTMVDLGR